MLPRVVPEVPSRVRTRLPRGNRRVVVSPLAPVDAQEAVEVEIKEERLRGRGRGDRNEHQSGEREEEGRETHAEEWVRIGSVRELERVWVATGEGSKEAGV